VRGVTPWLSATSEYFRITAQLRRTPPDYADRHNQPTRKALLLNHLSAGRVRLSTFSDFLVRIPADRVRSADHKSLCISLLRDILARNCRAPYPALQTASVAY
jgi:hypothetical protein